MLTIGGATEQLCDGLSRRDFLRIGALGSMGTLGAGLTLTDLLRLRECGAASPGSSSKAVIMIVLQGGPSQLDTYDLKPDAPAEYRGEFKPIQTNVPGIDICELMPMQATIADKLAIIRGFQTRDPCHTLEEVVTGFRPRDKRPAFGSIVSRVSDRTAGIPPFVSLTVDNGKRSGRRRKELHRAESPGYAGLAHGPFIPRGQALENLTLADGVTPQRLQQRKHLLSAFDDLHRTLDAKGSAGMDQLTARALEMITSPKIRDALDVNLEPESVRAKYTGRPTYGTDGFVKNAPYIKSSGTWEGMRFLQARRLVEAGVSVVSLTTGVNWDHHGRNSIVPESIFVMLRSLLPLLDRSIHALVTDLHERGLDKDVAVVMWGEFGRTPRVNKMAGRDHWNPSNIALLAGGGLRMGQVIGETDAHAAHIKHRLVTPQNVMATLYHVLGIDPSQTIPDLNGRPMYLLDERETIEELV